MIRHTGARFLGPQVLWSIALDAVRSHKIFGVGIIRNTVLRDAGIILSTHGLYKFARLLRLVVALLGFSIRYLILCKHLKEVVLVESNVTTVAYTKSENVSTDDGFEKTIPR